MTDEKGKPLSVRARLMKALGEELITSDIVALIELIKNAYDADAKNVLVRFSDIEDEEYSMVEVIDDGCGMSLSDIREKWMEIATTSKRKETHSIDKERRYLGAKGIGRFATSRLASELELISREVDGGNEVYAFFDWSQFDDDSLFLEDVLFLSEERLPEEIFNDWIVPLKDNNKEKEGFEVGRGTILRMKRLKKVWKKRDFIELQRSLSRLISPYSILEDFSIYLEVPGYSDDIDPRVGPPEIVSYPHYRCEGKVDADGFYNYKIYLGMDELCEEKRGFFYREKNYDSWSVVSSPNEMDEEDRVLGTVEKVSCGQFGFDLKFWDRDELESIGLKIDLGVKSLRSDLNHICGINIYRDKFRVLPYGEPNNDWLRLDVRRVQKPTLRISNNQVFGHISIGADENPSLRDSSNREGLDDTPGFRDLQSIMLNVLIDVENVRYGLRRGKKKKNNREKENRGLFDAPDFSSIRNKLVEQGGDSKEIESSLDELENTWVWQLTELKDRVSQYSSLASLGAIADKIVHDGSNPLSRIVMDSGLGEKVQRKYINSLSSEVDERLSENLERFCDISKNAEQVRTVFRHIEPFGGRKRGRPKKIYAADVVKDVFDFYSREIKGAGVEVNLPDNDCLVKIDEGEFRQVVQNLLENSLYWIKKVPKKDRYIVVKLQHSPGDFFEMIFADSGPGVPESDRDRIFEPYISGKEGGSGMGLAIIGGIIRDYYRGDLELLENDAGKGAVFRATFRERV